MAARVQAMTSAGLPVLVAVLKPQQRRDGRSPGTEKIIGFCHLDEHGGRATLFRYAFELEMFVHPGFVAKGVGKCLVDRLLEMVDTSYCARGGYEYVNHLETGESRVVKTILLQVHHEHGSDVEANGRDRWFAEYGFLRTACLPQLGFKLGKAVDVSVFVRHTSEEIDARARPLVAA